MYQPKRLHQGGLDDADTQNFLECANESQEVASECYGTI